MIISFISVERFFFSTVKNNASDSSPRLDRIIAIAFQPPAARYELRDVDFEKTRTNVLAVSDHGPMVGLRSDLTFSYRSGNMRIDCNDMTIS